MGTTATNVGKAAGMDDNIVPPWMVGLRNEVDRKYRAWCERRRLDPLDVHDMGANSGTMRHAIANQARAAMRRMRREKKRKKI